MTYSTLIKERIRNSIDLHTAILDNDELIANINAASIAMIECYEAGNKILFCGNGGSAADAQHLAAELSGRFYKERAPLFAEALHVNTSFLTAIANDYSFDEVYARLIKAKAVKGDILIAISTSGNSNNIIEASKQAKLVGTKTIGLTGYSGGKLVNYCDVSIRVPSRDTARIQEAHILIGHIICEIVEAALFPD